ncbi:MAG: flagellar basal body rod protein FlgB [Pseudomonadaceae bacterium]|nr:flagellar basal body rod protein FlgB [Pseudomonadaceae bacterium]
MPTTAQPSIHAALSARMNYLTDRQGVIAGNIANADTPEYKPRELAFAPYLERAQSDMGVRLTNPKHMAGGASGASNRLMESASYIQHNGNAVRLDNELVKMNQTQIDYRYMTQLYAKQASMQRLAIGRQQ